MQIYINFGKLTMGQPPGRCLCRERRSLEPLNKIPRLDVGREWQKRGKYLGFQPQRPNSLESNEPYMYISWNVISKLQYMYVTVLLLSLSLSLLGQIFSPFVFRFLTYLLSCILFLFALVFR